MSIESGIAGIPQIARGQVWCTMCGRMMRLDGVRATMGGGWPKCCGYTMTIDSPDERVGRKALEESR